MAILAVTLAALWIAGALVPHAAIADDQPPRDDTRRRLRVPILMYHYISVPPPDADRYRLDLSVTPAQFAQQVIWLRDNGYATVSLDDLYGALAEGRPLPPRPVILTFDDGYADAYHNAFPLLKTFGMTGTFFVVTEFLDRQVPGYLTWDQAREMAAAGMSIQSHTRTHHDLTEDCDYDCQVYQILGSAETIEAEIGARPRFFCYPGGRYDALTLQILDRVGVVAAVTTRSGTLHVNDRPLELKRARVRGTTRLADFAWMLTAWRE
jgi:peptidoglycan/xylan/chitin deacetylase (PgdA/CDA1 family)